LDEFKVRGFPEDILELWESKDQIVEKATLQLPPSEPSSADRAEA
jgi:hypothetical protein